jgi:hypothetical protein
VVADQEQQDKQQQDPVIPKLTKNQYQTNQELELGINPYLDTSL